MTLIMVNTLFFFLAMALVNVLREALARNDVNRAKSRGEQLNKITAVTKVKAFVQNIHHFRDDTLASTAAPIERVVISFSMKRRGHGI